MLRLRSQRKRLESIALRFELSCGNAVVLDVKPLQQDRFLSRFTRARMEGETWREVAIVGRREGTWRRSRPLRFAVRWTGETFSLAFGSKPTATDWRAFDIDLREWTSFPPSKLSIDFGVGMVCLCDFEIVGG